MSVSETSVTVIPKMPRTSKLTPEEREEHSRKYKKEWYQKNKELIMEKQKARLSEGKRMYKIKQILDDESFLNDLLSALKLRQAGISDENIKEEEHKSDNSD